MTIATTQPVLIDNCESVVPVWLRALSSVTCTFMYVNRQTYTKYAAQQRRLPCEVKRCGFIS